MVTFDIHNLLRKTEMRVLFVHHNKNNSTYCEGSPRITLLLRSNRTGLERAAEIMPTINFRQPKVSQLYRLACTSLYSHAVDRPRGFSQ